LQKLALPKANLEAMFPKVTVMVMIIILACSQWLSGILLQDDVTCCSFFLSLIVIEPLTLETKAILDTNTVPNLSIPKVRFKAFIIFLSKGLWWESGWLSLMQEYFYYETTAYCNFKLLNAAKPCLTGMPKSGVLYSQQNPP
jgi:hypothetical protein